MHAFNLKPTPSLIFGAGRIMELPEIADHYGKHLLLVTGGSSFTSSPTWSRLESELRKKGFTLSCCRISNEPSPREIDDVCAHSRSNIPDAVIAIGGGSVLDAGKAVSAMLKEHGSVTDYLEGVGNSTPSGRKVPFIAVPTTSGTGSEATSNAVISSVGPDGFKKSLRHDNYIPDYAVVDPQLTVSCPREITVSCGMDSFTQLVEAYLSTNSSPITDALAFEGIQAVIRSLPITFKNGDDLVARGDLSYGCYLSGIVLTNAGLGTVHGFASALGGYFPIPHGVVCGTLMATANKFTLGELLEKPETDPTTATALTKFARLGRLVKPNSPTARDAAQGFISYLEELTELFGLQRLSAFGITENDLEKIIASSSNKNNPVQFTRDQLHQILAERL